MISIATENLITAVLFIDRNDEIFYMAKVGDTIVSTWATTHEEAIEDAELFLNDPEGWLKQAIGFAAFIDGPPSIRPAVVDAQERLRHESLALIERYMNIKKLQSRWEKHLAG